MEGQVLISGEKSFSYLVVDLPPGQSIITESGAMASMEDGLDLSASLNGGIVGALLLKFFGQESLFINQFSNSSAKVKRLYLTQTTPGELVCQSVNGDPFYIQPGSFVACTKGVQFKLKWAGISSWLGGEGLFRLQVSGQGFIWFGAYGAVVERDIDGLYVVDSGHLLSYPSNMVLKAKLNGSILTSFLSGEGIVLQLEGKGRVRLQTRSVSALAAWINPWFY